MPYYESVYIARQEISAQQVDALTDGFEDIIKQAGGSITKRENWGLKSLAYRIKKKPESALHSFEYRCNGRGRA